MLFSHRCHSPRERENMRRRNTALLLASAAAIGFWSANVADAAPKIALNVDGQANYSFLAPWANIAGQFDPGNNITYWTGYIDGQYPVTWTGAGAPSITGGRSTFTVTGPGKGVLNLQHDKPGPNGGGMFQLQLNG